MSPIDASGEFQIVVVTFAHRLGHLNIGVENWTIIANADNEDTIY